MNKDSEILISGAGIAGLTAALWLSRAGFRPVVVEKAAHNRSGGFLVSLAHHAYRFADELGLIGALRERDCRVQRSSYHDESGRILLKLDSQKLFANIDVVQIMRDELADALYQVARHEVEIRFTEEMTELSQTPQSAKVRFSSGKEAEFDLVIGADGLHSGVRPLVFEPDEVVHHYLDLWCAAFRLPNVLEIQNEFQTHMRRDRYMATFSTGSDDIASVFVWANDGRQLPATREQRREVVQTAFAQSGGSITQAVTQAPQDRDFYLDVLEQVELPGLVRDSSVLVGDAAHCLTLFSGRGAGAAFTGASRLSQALIEHDKTTALKKFEAQMLPIVRNIQPATRKAVRWYVPRTRGVHFIRNNAMRFLPNALFRAYFKMKYSNV